MNKARQLAYNYLNLPHHEQIIICEKLSILPENWRNLKTEEFNLAVFKKLGKNKNKLEKFEKLINNK